MKLLYITESVPNRDPKLGDGSSMIPFELLRNFPEDVAVTLLTFAGPVDLPEEIRERCEAVHVLPTRQRRAALARSIFSAHDVGTHERATKRAIHMAEQLSGECDSCLVHGPHVLFLAPHLRAPMVLQTVDPWSTRVRMESSLSSGWRAAYRAHKSRRLLGIERQLPVRARLLTVSSRDAADWSQLLGRPVRSISNGADRVGQTVGKHGSRVVCFIGSLNYGPNIASVEVLINEIAPLVWAEVPEAKFVVAGRQPTSQILSLAGPRVDVLANVPSVAEIFQTARVAAFPDEYGIGIRNSVHEALAAGLPVVATPVAAREQEPHPLLTVEKDTSLFVRQIIHHLTTEPMAGGVRARERTWEEAAREYLAELQEAVARPRNERQAGERSL